MFSLLWCLGFITVCMVTRAQSYTLLWKQVSIAQQKDLPKTAIKSVDRIIEKARKENEGGELMKALLVRGNLNAEIAPDSAGTFIGLLENNLKVEKSPEMQSLYHAVLGKLYANRNQSIYEDASLKAKEHYVNSLQNPDALGKASAEKYVPFVMMGKDSRYFDNDLLHVVARFSGRGLISLKYIRPECDSLGRALYHQVISYYRVLQHREAAFFVLLDSAQAAPSTPSYLLRKGIHNENEETRHPLCPFYENLIREYGDLEVCVEAYIRLAEIENGKNAYRWATEGISRYGKNKRSEVLQNRIKELTHPELSIQLQQMQAYPGQQDSIDVEAVNMTHAVLKFYDTGLPADNKFFRILSKTAAKAYMKSPKLEIPITMRKGEPYEHVRKKLAFKAPERGCYIVVLEGEGLSSDIASYFVTDLHVMQMPLSPSQTRIVVSDAHNGKPIAGAQVVIRSETQDQRVVSTLETNEKGEVLVTVKNGEQLMAFAKYNGDVSCHEIQLLRGYRSGNAVSRKERHIALYSDRAIYRPGQTVQIGGFVYEKQGDNTSVVSDSIVLRLYDTNGKEVAQETVKSDDFGAFTAAFNLPSSCLNGHFSVITKNGSCSFRIEEYKRPTFRVEFDDVKTAYSLGESVLLKGNVKTYSGFPMSDTRVAVTLKRRTTRYFYSNYADERILRQDTVTTGSDGSFSFNMFLDDGETEGNIKGLLYLYDIEAVAISESGESESASCHLYASRQSSFLSTTLPHRICRDDAKNASFQFLLRNAASQPVKGNVRFEVFREKEKMMEQMTECNRKIAYDCFMNLPSGEYELHATLEGGKDSTVQMRQKFIWFSVNDRKAVGAEPLQIYQNAASFEGHEVLVHVATPLQNAYLHYDLFAADKLLESKIVYLSDEAVTMPFSYQENYGDGICAVFSLVRDGQLYHQSVCIRKPEPQKKIQLRWSSFRNHLQAGQSETWTLQVLQAGKPVSASLMATLYDASLDKFSKLQWPFSLYFERNIPSRYWYAYHLYGLGLNIMSSLQLKRVSELEFCQFDESLLNGYGMGHTALMKSRRALLPMAKMALQSNVMETRVTMDEDEMKMAVKADGAVVTSSLEVPSPAVALDETTSALRDNFNETAFFMPKLVTDSKGEVSMQFTLPQSLTQWNFKALAHTREVDYGTLDTMIVASKDFMVQPNMPRFLRSGDCTEIAVTLRNATDKLIPGNVAMELVDPSTGNVVMAVNDTFSLYPLAVMVKHFPVSVTNEYPILVCRTSARSNDFSDGEQHYLPILDDIQEVMESVPLTLLGKGTKKTSLSHLFGGDVKNVQHPRLTIEYTSNPVWLALEALPALAAPMSYDAVSMSTAYYALVLAAQEAKKHPDIERMARLWREKGNVDSLYLLLERNADLKQTILNETPWVAAADGERQRLLHLGELFDANTLSLRRQSYLDRLLSMQGADGAWSWYKGMSGSFSLTVEVCETLAKLGALVPDALQRETLDAMKRAQKYMAAEVHKSVLEMKRWQQKTKEVPVVSSLMLRYLFICSLRQLSLDADGSYLIALLEKSAREYNMYDKATSAVVLQYAGKLNAAKLTLQSLMEHTVTREGMGRWFDTDRAMWSWNSYRIPTQVAALNALCGLTPADTVKIEEMTRWLLQAKRTQTWDNPRSSVDALYYLFMKSSWLSEKAQIPEMKLSFTNQSSIMLSEDASSTQPLGYVRKTLEKESITGQPDVLSIQKTTASPAFGNVHAQYLVPVSKVTATSAGWKMRISYKVRRGDDWEDIDEGMSLQVGDLIRVRYEIEAERDYDFVSLKENRPACAEPVQGMSGYDYISSGYRSVGDASTTWFFTQLRKGRYVFESQWRMDRTGTFTGAVPVLQCAYAPEFNAHGVQSVWNVK